MCCSMALLPSPDHCTVRGPGRVLTLLLHLLSTKGQFFRLPCSRDMHGWCQSCLYSPAWLFPCTWSEAALTCLADRPHRSLLAPGPMAQTWDTLGTPMASPQQTMCLYPSHHSRHGPAVPLLQPLHCTPRPGPGAVPSVSLGAWCCTSSQYLNPPCSTRMTRGRGGQLEPCNQPGINPWGSILHPLPAEPLSSLSELSAAPALLQRGHRRAWQLFLLALDVLSVMVGSMSSHPSEDNGDIWEAQTQRD